MVKIDFKFIYSIRNEVKVVLEIFQDKKFIIENGYEEELKLPQGISLLTNFELETLERRIEKEFNQKSAKKVEEELLTLIKKNENILDSFLKSFRYKAPKIIKIILTRYDVNGSYYLPDKLVINICSDRDYFETFVHELIHLVVEKPIIQEKNLNQVDKEGLVDYIMVHNQFIKRMLPDYQPQPMSENPSDDLLRMI